MVHVLFILYCIEVLKMFYIKFFLHLIFLRLTGTAPQLNLYFTDIISENNNNNDVLQHTCLYVSGHKLAFSWYTNHLNIAHCMSEPSTNFEIKKMTFFQNLLLPNFQKKVLLVNNYIYGQHQLILLNVINFI